MLVKHRMDRKFVILFQELAAAVTGSAGKKVSNAARTAGGEGEGVRARGGGGGTTAGLMGKREIAMCVCVCMCVYIYIYIYIYIYRKCGLINYYGPGPQQPRERRAPST